MSTHGSATKVLREIPTGAGAVRTTWTIPGPAGPDMGNVTLGHTGITR